MTVQTIIITADVPEEQQTAAQAAAATFVAELPHNVEGATVLSATYGGVSLLPTPAERFAAAREKFDALAAQNTIKAADLKAALAELDDATAAYELSLQAPAVVAVPPIAWTPPAPLAAGPVTVDAATAAATVPAPTGDEPAVTVDAATAAAVVPAVTGDEPVN